MKKKLIITILIFTVFLLFQSQSPWEGAAGVSSDGELPASGFFIATNSFPRNTIVDVTNIENGKSTRAIVANTVSNPGLLAVVSREAAELIGMRSGSVSRIRIVSPSDPIAYQRFTEGLAQEIPPYDSGNIIRSEAELLAEVYGEDSFKPSNGTPAVTSPGSEYKGPSYQMEPEWGGSSRLEIVDIPRFNEEPVGPFTDPVNENKPIVIAEEPPARVEEPAKKEEPVVKEPYVAEPPPYVPPQIIEEKPPVQIAEVPPNVIETKEDIVKNLDKFNAELPVSDIEKQTSSFLTEAPLENVEKQTSPHFAEVPREDIVKDVPRFISENYGGAAVKHVQGFRPEHASGAITKDVEGFYTEQSPEEIAKNLERINRVSSSAEVVKDVQGFYPELSQADVVKNIEGFKTEQSPEDIVKIVHYFSPEQSRDDIVKIVQGFYPNMSSNEIIKILQKFYAEQELSEIAKAANEFETFKKPDDPKPNDPQHPYQPLPADQKEFNIVSTTERPPVYPFGINPEAIIPGVTSIPQERPVVTQPVTPAKSFILDSISSLDRGQYYVQFASSSADSVENTIKQFDPQVFKYDPKVFMDRDNLYRIVIGPLNQGESAAVLARFKSIGYRDAFVRRGG